MLRLNVLNCRPCVLKTPDIHRVNKCALCGKDLSEFTEIQLYDNKEIENLKGKVCIDCDLVYVSSKAPDCVFDITKDKFKEFVHIESINPN